MNKPIASARAVLGRESTAEFVYRGIKEDSFGQKLPPFRFSSVLSAQYRIFTGTDYSIPGLYTQSGYQRVFLPMGLQRLRAEIKQNWVLGTSYDLSEFEILKLYGEIEDMYFKDYAEQWTTAVGKLGIREAISLNDLSSQLAGITSGTEPFIQVLQAIKDNTTFFDPAQQAAEKLASATEGAAEAAAGLSGPAGQLANMAVAEASTTVQSVNKQTARQAVSRHFNKLNQLLISDEDRDRRLNMMEVGFNDMHETLSSIIYSARPAKSLL